MKIVISDCSWNNYDVETETIKKHMPDAEVVCAQVEEKDDIIALCKDADAVLSEYARFTPEVLEQMENIKIISNSAMGVDNIDLDACMERGIAVANVPGYCVYEVAEHIVALVLGCHRWIYGYDRSVKAERQWEFNIAPKLFRIQGQTLGMIGCGRIARTACEMMKGFGFGRVIGYDPYLPKEVAAASGITLVSTLQEIAEEADIVISHVPGLPGTDKMVNEEFFRACKKSPVFINAARGSSVDYDALARALKDGKVSQAGLDVVDHEPADFGTDIFSVDEAKVLFTPHAAFYSETALEECRRESAMNVINYLSGNKDKVYYVAEPGK